MPWTPAQHRLFEAAKHDAAIAKAHGMTQQKAGMMADEGIKKQAKRKGLLGAANGRTTQA